MKKILAISFLSVLLFTAVFPAFALAETEPLVSDKCGRVIDGKFVDCGFGDLMSLIDRVIDFALFVIALPLAAIMFAYAGLSLIMAQGAEGKTKAKSIFSSVISGLVIAAAAWLIIKTLLSILGYDVTWIFG